MKSFQELELYELYYLILICYIKGEEVVSYDMIQVWKRIGDKYFDETGKMLDIYDEDERICLFNWMREKTRYQLLNALIYDMVIKFIDVEGNGIDNRDEFFINNVYIMNDIMSCDYQLNNQENNLSKLNKTKTIDIIKEILLEIDSNGEWLRIYEEALLNDKIVYLNELNNNQEKELRDKLGITSLKYVDNSCLSIGKNKEWYIFLRYTGTIIDISTTIHEIVHYINKYYDESKREKPLLREFPSIFFELYALNYLKKIGYGANELAYIYNERLSDTHMVINDTRITSYYLKMFIDNNIITEKIDNELNNEINCFGNNKRNCDKVIKDLIANPYFFFERYPYIIGNFLANKAMRNIDNDDQLIAMIRYITERLSRINVGDVFRIIVPEMEIIDDKENKTKVKKKK